MTSTLYFKPYYLGCLAHASFLVGDTGSGVAAVVDPQRDIDGYIADAEAAGLRIQHVFLTHFHADFLAGHLEMRARTGADIRLGQRASAEYPIVKMGDGDILKLGRVSLEVIETPGHTPESICIAIHDGDQRFAVLTGDTLFVGDVGRPDLLASIGVTSDQLAAWLYHSLHDKLLELPDETRYYPSHGAGSMCGKNLGSEAFSTIGQQKLTNYAVQPMSEAEFKALVTAGQPECPPYFVYDAMLNRQQHATLDEAIEAAMRPLSLQDVVRLQNAGAQILDSREADDFATLHLAGSYNIGLSGKYATWAGTVLQKDRPIIVVSNPGEERDSIMRLGRIGFDHIAGYLEGGVQALAGSPDVQATLQRIDPAEVAPGATILDVRAPSEYKDGRLPGAINVPLNQLEARLEDVPPGPLVVQCRSGYRSCLAVSMLKRHGRHDAVDLRGGILAWQKSGLPVETPVEV